jgi:hypothetical protein
MPALLRRKPSSPRGPRLHSPIPNRRKRILVKQNGKLSAGADVPKDQQFNL